MIKDITIEVSRGRIIFSCPHCLKTDVFPTEMVGGVSGTNSAIKCPQCANLVAVNKPKIEAAVKKFMSEDPLLKYPLQKTEKTSLTPAGPISGSAGDTQNEYPQKTSPAPATIHATRGVRHSFPASGAPVLKGKLPADYVMQRVHGDKGTPMPSAVGLTDLILVVDQEDSFRDDIWIIFSDIARVEGYRGVKGAADYIISRADEVRIMMMDLFLGDGSCFEVLDALKVSSKASGTPTIVAYTDIGQYEVVKKGLSGYPQVKAFIQKEELIKKMIELSIKIVKK